MNIGSNAKLIAKLEEGKKVKFLFFWGHQERGLGPTKKCLSQWYESPFEKDGMQFLTAEHYMMFRKAMLFGDVAVAEKVLQARTSGEAKRLGREVRNFDQKTWVAHRFDIVVEGNMAKFSSTPDLRDFLINTGNRVLVEASPVDRIWGIGLAEDSLEIENPYTWDGLNLLGYALMEVRSQLIRNTHGQNYQ